RDGSLHFLHRRFLLAALKTRRATIERDLKADFTGRIGAYFFENGVTERRLKKMNQLAFSGFFDSRAHRLGQVVQMNRAPDAAVAAAEWRRMFRAQLAESLPRL